MGKVQVIKKSRKEYKCSKCGKVIPAGSRYYKGEINFGPTIIRCTECGLEHWEVTTSDYQLRAGEIVYRWKENYEASQDGIDSITNDLQELCDELQDRLDNMPEGLQDGDVGQLLQERIDTLEDAISEMESIDIDSIQEDKFSDYVDSLDFEDDDSDLDEDSLQDYSDAEEYLKSKDREDDWTEIESNISEGIEEAIDEALSGIEV